jgi:hemolysin activation/secretion protein
MNAEYRLLPGFNILNFNFGAVAFYDIGAVWNQSQKLPQTRFHSSAGIGLRVSGGAGKIDQGLFRIDLAYNFDQRKLAQIIFSTQEAFDVFGSLDYQPPGPFVP